MTPSNRELLERAAKAAGYEVRNVRIADTIKAPELLVLEPGKIETLQWWSPLLDDGDRYRLARKLRLVIDFHACQVLYDLPDSIGTEYWTPGDEESEALAIVRAAAAIQEGGE